MNRIGNGFNFSKDFVLKAGLMLTDTASVGFKVENFTHDNMKKLEDNWEKIHGTLIRTVELAASFGYNRDTIRAVSSLLPIAYYIYRRNCPENFITHGNFAADRAAIRGWLTRSLGVVALIPCSRHCERPCDVMMLIVFRCKRCSMLWPSGEKI